MQADTAGAVTDINDDVNPTIGFVYSGTPSP